MVRALVSAVLVSALVSSVRPTGGTAVSVLAFGAKADGRADDTDAFHAALAASLDVFVPGGNYRIRRTLVLRDLGGGQ
jgi:polygalacturonase